MSDLQTILARIDLLEANNQKRANAIKGVVDAIWKQINPVVPDGKKGGE